MKDANDTIEQIKKDSEKMDDATLIRKYEYERNYRNIKNYKYIAYEEMMRKRNLL